MKIAIFTHIDTPATDFYRTVGCYAHMGYDIKYLTIDTAKWYDIIDLELNKDYVRTLIVKWEREYLNDVMRIDKQNIKI